LVEVVLRFGGNGNLDVILLDLGELWAVLVMVSVASATLWANMFHGV
jgi:hypothetical protein